MPRTIESIVKNHRVANERRRTGRPVWDKTINIREILLRDQDNTNPAHVVEVAHEIAQKLRRCLPEKSLDFKNIDCDQELLDIVENLEGLHVGCFGEGSDYTELEELNGRLDELYDWADRNRVWLGP